MTALEWFDQAIEREKAARKANGKSETLGEDVMRLLRECAERFHSDNE
jgi:hypothetical protein